MKRLHTGMALLAAVALSTVAVMPAIAAPKSGIPDGNKIWNGYVTRYTKTSEATYVQAQWNVPHTKCAGPFKTTSASIWVGLGGVNSPVVQIGVETLCDDGVIQFIYPVWEVTPPQSSAQIIFHRVSAGDLMFASVQYKSGGKYELTITDNNKSWITWNKTVDGPKPVPQEADWIVEAGGKPLADFGTVSLANCFWEKGAGGPQFLKNVIKFEAGTSKGLETSVSPVSKNGSAFKVKYVRA